MDNIITHFLSISYFLGMTAAAIKAVRYSLDYRRLKHRRYIIGVLSSVALVMVFVLIIVAAGRDPRIPPALISVCIRASVICYAVTAFVFEMSYGKTWISVKKKLGEVD